MRFPLLAAITLVALGTGPVCRAQGPARTQLRHAHVLRVLCDGETPAVITIHAISASLGYTDAASFEATGPDGATLARGTVAPGESRQVMLAPPGGGCCILVVDPLRNAFAVDVEGAEWAIDVGDDLCIDVIADARPLRFWLPAGTRRVPLRFSGEAATVRVVRPDGSLEQEVTVPQYQTVSMVVDVPGGIEAGFWTLELQLSEDLGVTLPIESDGLVVDHPVEKATFGLLRGMGALASFDRRPASAEALCTRSRPSVAHSISAGELRLDLAASGAVLGVRSGHRNLTPRRQSPLGGFIARDVARGSGFVPLEGRVQAEGDGVRVRGEFPGLDLSVDAALRPAGEALDIRGELVDRSGTDRAVSLYFVLPLAARGWYWHDDAATSRKIASEGLHTSVAPCAAGANGTHSSYPLACVSGRAALAMAIDPMQPRIFRIGYEAGSEQLYCVQDVGLCAEHKVAPSRAGFSMAVYGVDPEWGFRSAIESYWALYPQAFEKRMQRHGGWICWRTMDGIPEPEKTGMLYHWGPATSDAGKAVAYDDGVGTYSFLYNDSVRFFSDLGVFAQRPTAEEARQPFRRFLEADDPLATVLDAPESATGRARWLGLEDYLGERDPGEYALRCREAVRNSYCENVEGDLIPGYLTNRKDWGPENWWTGRLLCNPDPDIPDGYGRFLRDDVIGLTWDYLKAHGAHPDGVGLDNYLVNANDLNYRRDHFRYADIPLTFDRTGRLAICGDFQLLEWVSWLKDWLKQQDCYLIPNAVGRSWPFLSPHMDIFGLELGYKDEAAQLYYATLAGGRPVVTLPLDPTHYAESWVKMHLAIAMLPGGYGGSAELTKPDSEYRAILARYMPVLQRMSRAGWRPITEAVSSSESVGVERFGPGSGGEVFFSVRNRGTEEARAQVRFDLTAAGVPDAPRCRLVDAVSGEAMASAGADGVATLEVRLQPGDVMAVGVMGGLAEGETDVSEAIQ